VRRNRLAFAATGAVALALVLGLAAASWQAVQARREAQRAQQAEALAGQRLAESEAVSKFMIEAFQSLDPLRDGRTITVAESLEVAAKRLEEELASQPALQVRLQAAIAMTYSGLGLDQAASQLQEKVRDYYLARSGPDQPHTLQAMHNLANSYHRLGRHPEALELRTKVLTCYRELLGEKHPRTLAAMQNLAVSYDAIGRHADAQLQREKLLALRLELLGPEDPNTLSAMHSLAHSYWIARCWDRNTPKHFPPWPL
jgi:tetratricopeptide (TPR) repeat protein